MGRMSKKKLKTRLLVHKRWNKNDRPTPDIEPQPSTSVEENRPNVISIATADSRPSASVRKLSTFNVEEDNLGLLISESKRANNYVLFHTSMLENLFQSLICVKCGAMGLNTVVEDFQGFAANVSVKCPACQTCCAQTYTSPRVSCESSSRPPFEVNKRVVSAFSEFGRGYAAIEKFCMSMGMHVMSKSTYNSHLQDRAEDDKILRHNVLDMAHNAVRKAYTGLNQDQGPENVVDITVSYDGSWHKRGHMSHYGVGIVIDVLTGLVIDFEVLSTYCATCSNKVKTLNKDSEAYKEWMQNHKESGECEANYSGSAGSMEVAIAEVLWKRSVNVCGMRYVTMLSDGDSKAFNHLQSLKVYGNEVKLQKDECINHVSKRLVTGLNNIVSEWRAKRVTVGGTKPGRLTKETILKLQLYYRQAIKNNIPNVQHMKTAIYATLYHAMSTDEKPQHFKCPGGASSWCFYNRATARGEIPPKHDKTTMTTVLDSSVVTKIIPVYQKLASNELLERCKQGKTQNTNECLHSVIWNYCPKTVFVAKKKVDIAVTSAVSVFNMGCEVSEKLKESATGLDMSESGMKVSMQRDKRRINQSVVTHNTGHRSVRKRLKFSKMASQHQKKRAEGTTYGAGQF